MPFEPGTERYQKYHREYNKRRRADPVHRDRIRENARASNKRVRLEVLAHYGNVCVCCGETEARFLTLDHINGRSKELRRSRMSSSKLAYKLKRDGYPKDIQVLCFNCNCAKGFFGVCPHTQKDA